MAPRPIPIVVFSSGYGSNFQAILDHIAARTLDAKVLALITDNPEAEAIARAEKSGIPVHVFDSKNYPIREEFDLAIKKTLDQLRPELVILAGYMKIIRSKELLSAYKYRILNIHPSLLPAFKGTTVAQEEAFSYGCKVSGLTIHFVTDDVDGGPIVYQEAVDISDCLSAEDVRQKILEREHVAFSKAMGLFAEHTAKVEGRRVVFERK